MKEGWEYNKLGEVCDFFRGLTYSKNDEVEQSDNMVLRSNNIDFASHRIYLDDVKCIRQDLNVSVDKKLKDSSILICMSNGSHAHLGKTAFISKAMNYAFGGFMGLICPNDKSVFPKFCFYATISQAFLSYIEKLGNGANIKNLKWSDLQYFSLPVPPLSEQQAIVEELDLLNAIIDKKKEELEEMDKLAQAIFYDMFGDPVENEKGWEVKKLGDVTNVGTGSTPNRKNESYYIGDIPWVKSTEVCNCIVNSTQEHISKQALNETNCTIYPQNSVLIAMYGQGKTRGQVAVLGIDAATNQAVAAIAPSANLNSVFLYMQLHLMYNKIRNMSRGGTQSNLNMSLVKSIPIILPPLPLLQQFAARISAIEQMKEKVEASMAEVQTLLAATMDKYFG